MTVEERFAQVKRILDTASYCEGSRAFLVSGKWFFLFRKAAEKKDQSFSRKINNDNLFSNGHVNPLLKEKYDFLVFPREAWELVDKWYGSTTDVPIPVFQRKKDQTWFPCVYPKEIMVYYHQKPFQIFKPKDVYIDEILRDSCYHFGVQYEGAKLIDYWELLPGHELEQNIQIGELTNRHSIDFALAANGENALLPLTEPVNGRCGLRNIGNTCFMNSILQCLSHCDIIKDLVLSGEMQTMITKDTKFQKEVAVVEEFIDIVKRIWNGCNPVIEPYSLQNAISQIAKQFANMVQHDAGEFLTTLLTCLSAGIMRPTRRQMLQKEDSNDNISKAALAEIDNSFIGDNFFGLHKVTTVCPKCQFQKDVFSSFSALTLRIPSEATAIKVTFVSFDLLTVKRFFIAKSENDTPETIKAAIQKQVGIDNLIFSNANRLCPIDPSMSEIYAYEVESTETSFFVLVSTDFIIPFIVEINELTPDPVLLQIIIQERLSVLWDSNPTPESVLEKTLERTPNHEFSDIFETNSPTTFSASSHSNNQAEQTISVAVNPSHLKSSDGARWDLIEKLLPPPPGINIYDCMMFTASETQLDNSNLWTCPNCTAPVNALRKTLVWTSPKILAIQFSRLQLQKEMYEKDSRFITFPNQIDINQYVHSEASHGQYKLFGVVNHGGSLTGGHYTANIHFDNEWVFFSDKMFQKSSEEEAHSQKAYILFYQRI